MPEEEGLTLNRAFESIALIEDALIEHEKVLILIKVQLDFLLGELLKHRLIEFKRPPKNMKELVAQLEPIEGMARYCLDAINRLLPLQEKVDTLYTKSNTIYIYSNIVEEGESGG